MAEALVNTFKPLLGTPHPIQELVLIPSSGGRYEVTLDGEVVYSKATTHQHTTNEYVIEQVRKRLK